MTQADVVDYFKNWVDGGALIFNQSILSRKHKNQEQLEEQAKLNPSALSYKRPRIVTRPDVEHALVLWVKHMEEKREREGPLEFWRDWAVCVVGVLNIDLEVWLTLPLQCSSWSWLSNEADEWQEVQIPDLDWPCM